VKEFLSQNNVPYEEKNVAVDRAARQEMLSLTGRSAVPTVKIGDEVIVGFDKARISKLLGL
jgi:glutaredoxin